MIEFECPECDGGFAEPVNEACPWCGHEMENAEEKPQTQPLFDTPNQGLGIDLSRERELDPGEKKCPECGEPMPMLTYTDKEPVCYRCQNNDSPLWRGRNKQVQD